MFMMASVSLLSYVKLMVLLAVFTFIICDTTTRKYSVLFKDVLVGESYKVHDSTSKLRCARECHKTTTCLSFAYSTNEKKCYFYDRVSLWKGGRTSHHGIITYVPRIENVALNKYTEGGSNINSYETPDKAVNGNFEDRYQSLSRGRQWWCVDLGMTYDLQTVVIYNRLGPYAERFRYFEMRLSKSPGCNIWNMDSTPSCYKNDGSTNYVYTVSLCNQPSSGFDGIRAVFFILYNENIHFREVEVYAK